MAAAAAAQGFANDARIERLLAEAAALNADFKNFGLGVNTLHVQSDLDDIAAGTTFFRWNNTTAARPEAYGVGIQFERAVGFIQQLAIGVDNATNSNRIFSRAFSRGAKDTPWSLDSNKPPKITYVTSSTTHTYDSLARAALIEGVGGGGGGGGTDAPSGQVQAASGGAAGSYFSKLLTDLPEEAVILIGGGGSGGPATASSVGGSGGTTSYTDTILGTISAPGGTRGQAHGAYSGNSIAIPQPGRVYPPESDIQGTSEPSTLGLIILGSARVTGYGGGGGSSPFGSGGQAGWVSTANGTAAGGSGEPGLGYGSGGGGSVSYGNEGKSTGAAGAPGLVKITEYF